MIVYIKNQSRPIFLTDGSDFWAIPDFGCHVIVNVIVIVDFPMGRVSLREVCILAMVTPIFRMSIEWGMWIAIYFA